MYWLSNSFTESKLGQLIPIKDRRFFQWSERLSFNSLKHFVTRRRDWRLKMFLLIVCKMHLAPSNPGYKYLLRHPWAELTAGFIPTIHFSMRTRYQKQKGCGCRGQETAKLSGQSKKRLVIKFYKGQWTVNNIKLLLHKWGQIWR